MTMLLAMKCNDGVVLASDSAAYDAETKKITNDGNKTILGRFGDIDIALVFGGDARIGEKLTRDIIIEATEGPGDDAKVVISQALHFCLAEHLRKGPWPNDGEKTDFEQTARVYVILAIGPEVLWSFEVSCKGVLYQPQHEHRQIAYCTPMTTPESAEKIMATMQYGAPSTMGECLIFINQAFQQGMSLSEQCMYPVTTCTWYRGHSARLDKICTPR